VLVFRLLRGKRKGFVMGDVRAVRGEFGKRLIELAGVSYSVGLLS